MIVCVHFLYLLHLAQGAGVQATGQPSEAPPDRLIGYTELRTNLAGGRHVNVATMRAVVVRADGTGRRVLAEELTRDKDTWTQFQGWSPDGRTAIIGSGWESPANGEWEEKHKTFRFNADVCRSDMVLLELASGKATNVSAVERISFYNGGLFFWPGDDTKLVGGALIDGNMHPFRMDRDGKNKRDLTKGSSEFTYGCDVAPDGKRIAYHKSYRVYIANADGAGARKVETGQPFNFVPLWSPDGNEILFLAGEHYNCHPHIVRADGTGLRKLADRGGYRGVIEFLDVPDYHGGSSDYPVWSADGRAIFYTALVGRNVELFRVPRDPRDARDGKPEQLTDTPAGSQHYHPRPSPDGKWLVYGSKRAGVRQLYVMRLDNKVDHRITDLTAGHGAMWPHWQPAVPKPSAKR
jgi:TolB protein